MEEKIKIKPMIKSQIEISLDRLTRFKPTEEKYLRVFCDILTSNLIEPKFSKKQLLELDYGELAEFVEAIFEKSMEELRISKTGDFAFNKALLKYEKSIFEFDKNVEKLLDNKIDYRAMSDFMQKKQPVKKIVLVEGLTEEILLPKFADLCGFDFEDNGVHIISAGGKNQVVKLFYKYAEILKLPIFVLLDADAKENFSQIELKLRKNDKVYLLECGEFEDTLPLNLIKRTLNRIFDYPKVQIAELRQNIPMTQILDEIFHSRGQEFKKAEFASLVAQNVKNEDVSEEIRRVILEIN